MLQATIDAVPCDAVLIATPIDLRHLVTIRQPSTRVKYDLVEHDRDVLPQAIGKALAAKKGATAHA